MNLAFGGAGYPVEGNTIELAASAEVDVDPFFIEAGAHPGAGEVVWATDLDALFTGVELYLADQPAHSEVIVGLGVR